MTLLYYDPIFQAHRTGNHPERPERLERVVRHLQWVGLDAICKRPMWKPIAQERLAKIHSIEYADHIRILAKHGGGWIDEDTVISEHSYDAALMAAGAVTDAVERVVRGDDRRALCLVRPPGHHALSGSAMGFCLFNNVAIGARLATDELVLDRVLIVDWDVHHGNGTQDAFWDSGRVGFLSIHRHPFYPGTGAETENGTRDGLGTTVNLPVAFGISRKNYIALFENELSRFAAQFKPQLIMVSAGFDAHREDPVGSLNLETEDFRQLTRIVLQVANDFADGRIVSVLEGGYNPGALTDCIDAHLSELLEEGQ